MAGRRTVSGTVDKPLSFIERARREQLIEVTIGLVAEHGYAATSLARIAQAAGITKGAVLYHFASKDAVMEAAYAHALNALVADVGAAVDAAPPDGAPAAYVRRMVGHLAEHPDHARMIIEAMANGDRPVSEARWKPLAALLQNAREARNPGPGSGSGTGTGTSLGTGPGPGPSTGPESGSGQVLDSGPGPGSGPGSGAGVGPGAGVELRTLALIVGGAIDALVGEGLRDGGYDVGAGAESLVAMVEVAVFG